MGQRVYHARGSATLLAAAHAAGVGFYWLTCPAAATVRPTLTRLRVSTQLASGLLTVVATEIVAQRISFDAGIPAGLVTSVREDVLTAAAVATLGNAVGTLAGIVTVETFASWMATANIGAAPVSQAPASVGPDWTGRMILNPLGGVLLQQFSAGVVADTRRLTVDYTWEE
jgi:hypothetical protein